ncbi:MAG: hypothetical protein JKY43_06055 [Phycisphaerales bacterium]|nr:hypothetical protein [Phycisphaerales bacterium]
MSEEEISQRVRHAFENGELVDQAMKKAGQRAYQYHAWTNTKLRVWRDGRVVEIDPKDPDAELPAGFEVPKSGTPPWVGL